MSQRKRKEPAPGQPALEAMKPMPKGGETPRCQARKRDGSQCGAAARTGFAVCPRHGAGLRAREESGEKRPAGRPIVHGLYSRKGKRVIDELVAELEAAQTDMDNTDGEMRVLRATLSYLLSQAPKHEALADTLDETIAALQASLEAQMLTPEEAGSMGRVIGLSLQGTLAARSWLDRIVDAARHTVNASKHRSEIKAKMAEARALESVARFARIIRHIMWDMLDEEQLDVLEDRLQREVFAPNGLEMPSAREDGLKA